ncbi:hypothetical protein [Saccharopolyspora taberi]|uniref:DUF3592 domain-containing protein n=1 Tax=Saccharopolyspora taberi TaxID=60895 RepID=A0ABN3VNE9_9PSEU
MSRKALITVTAAWGILVGVVAAVFLGVAIFSGTVLDETAPNSSSTRVTEQYRWNGQPMLITPAARNGKTAHCKVAPDRGEPRDVSSYRSESRYGVTRIQPWFSGSATVTCQEKARIRTGSQVTMYELATKNRVAQIAAAVIGAGPFAVVLVFGLGKKKANA